MCSSDLAAGEAQAGEMMTPQHKFRIASMSKTFTATVVLQLVEEGKLGLDKSVAEQLPDRSYVRFEKLVRNGYGRKITVRQLLTHTSGLADYISDERFVAGVMNHPQTQWSPKMIFEKYYEYGLDREERFPPGQGFYYSDTNYVLLGLLIEHITGQSLAKNYRERITGPLAMQNTFLEFYEAPRGKSPMSYPYHELVSTQEVNTSFDWGGGGLVSTVEEIDRFLRALLQGKLFQKKATLNTMLSFRPEADARFALGLPGSEYGMGIRRLSFEKRTLIGHSGSWGCIMYYDPAQDLSIVATVNQGLATDQLAKLLQEVVNLH